ncbi:hypothetical protein E2542_SST25231 [Spatholobus suberectus]|nr:hypothetical protein E2542_SST25231 [Spatholobus suberectus]
MSNSFSKSLYTIDVYDNEISRRGFRSSGYYVAVGCFGHLGKCSLCLFWGPMGWDVVAGKRGQFQDCKINFAVYLLHLRKQLSFYPTPDMPKPKRIKNLLKLVDGTSQHATSSSNTSIQPHGVMSSQIPNQQQTVQPEISSQQQTELPPVDNGTSQIPYQPQTA